LAPAGQPRIGVVALAHADQLGLHQQPLDARGILLMPSLAVATPLDDFVYSLDYDPKSLLAVVPDGDISSQPLKKRGADTNAVIITTTTQHKLSKSLSDVAILRPTAGVIFPGSAVLADRNLMDGQPTPIGLPRAPVTVSVDLPGLQPSEVVVNHPTTSSVQNAIARLVEKWIKDPAHAGYINAARSYYQVTSAFSSEQASLDLGVSAKWASGDASSQLAVKAESQTSTVMAYYKQVFYTVTIDTPARPSAFFAKDVGLADLQRVVSAEHPPAYVRSVDYGRILMLKMTTSSSQASADLQAAFSQAAESASGRGSIDAKYQNILKNSQFQVLALGGGAKAAASFSGNDDGLATMREYVQAGAAFGRDNPGAPIAYNVAFMKDNQLATMGFTTDYTETNSVAYPNGWVGLWHDGAYVAKFRVTWQVTDAQGNPGPVQEWESGDRTVGYSEKLNLPGDAFNIHITAEAATGLVWQPWNEAMNVVVKGVPNQWYRIYGTTLSPHSDNTSRG
jgi:thiol-activated cytolysin